MPSSSTRPKRSHTASSTTSRPSQQLHKTEITINVYDLLPPGRLSSLLWTIGSSLLHTGVEINGREYAYGGHGTRGATGVYWTKPRTSPPGATFRTALLHGFTLCPAAELDEILKDVSREFLGPRYNLLACNCNHFTSALCLRLVGRPAPAWLNRAAGVGLALPCVVPREWVAPPDVETAEGELLEGEDEEGEEEEEGEGAGMMVSHERRREREERRLARGEASRGEGGEGIEYSLAGGSRILARAGTPPPRPVALTDSSGREMPVAERAPVPKHV